MPVFLLDSKSQVREAVDRDGQVLRQTETRSPRLVGYVGKVFSDDEFYGSALDRAVPLGINLN